MQTFSQGDESLFAPCWLKACGSDYNTKGIDIFFPRFLLQV